MLLGKISANPNQPLHKPHQKTNLKPMNNSHLKKKRRMKIRMKIRKMKNRGSKGMMKMIDRSNK